MLPKPTAGRVVVITGASSEIGEALAREFTRRDHRVVLIARRAERLNALADELGEAAYAVPLDLSQRSGSAQLLDRITALGAGPRSSGQQRCARAHLHGFR